MTYAELLARAAPFLHLRALDGEQAGAMVALVPTAEDAARLAVPDGEPAGQLHATLVYLGEAADIPADVRAGLVERTRGLIEDAIRPDFAVPVVADGFAVSMFNPTGPAPCVVLGLSGADLDAVHRLVEAATAEVFAAPEQHRPWIGHVTLEYTGDAGRVEDLVDRAGPVTFDRLRLAFAGENVDLPLAPARVRSAVLSPYPAVREALEVYLNLPPLHVRYSDDQERDESGRFAGAGGGGGGSSGGKSGGGGENSGDRLAAASTVEEVTAATGDRLREITGRDVGVDFVGSDPDVARDHATGVIRAAEQYPGVEISRIGTYGPGGTMSGRDDEAYAFTRNGPDGAEIYFNNRYGSDPDYYDEALSADGESGQLAAATREGVAMHEFGHALVEQSSDYRGQISGAVWDNAVAQAREAGASGSYVREFVADGVSEYASTSVDEYAAEAFADVMWNGSRASPLSRAGYDIITSAYRERR